MSRQSGNKPPHLCLFVCLFDFLVKTVNNQGNSCRDDQFIIQTTFPGQA